MLTDNLGKTFYYPKGATPNADGTGLIENTTALYTAKFGTITISVTGLKNGETNILSAAGPYAGTYNFKVQINSDLGPQSKFSATKPTDNASVGALGTSDVAFTVVIGTDNSIDVSGLGGTGGDEIYFGISGVNTVGDGSEKAAFKIVEVA